MQGDNLLLNKAHACCSAAESASGALLCVNFVVPPIGSAVHCAWSPAHDSCSAAAPLHYETL